VTHGPRAVQSLSDPGPGRGLVRPRSDLDSSARKKPLGGEWLFRWLPQPPSDPQPPLLTPDIAEKIPVPASFVMPHLDRWLTQPHGSPVYTNLVYPFPVTPPHPPENNPVGEYQTTVEWKSAPYSAWLRFNGVEGAADVWWNGSYLGSTRGSRLPSEFDLTGKITGRDTLSLRVHQYSAVSYVEDQDCWWLPGIIRDVSLIERPPHRIDDVHVIADWDGRNGHISVEVSAIDGESFRPVDAVIRLEETGQLISPHTPTQVSGVNPWSAEDPQLYTLVISSPGGENSGETVRLRVGFRRVEIHDGVFLVNGSPITLKGVNRHEHHGLWGRYVPEEMVRHELALMKQHNINAIRTSHYPPDTLMLDLADELGFWVIDECDVETHGFVLIDWQDNPTGDSAYEAALVDRCQRMVHRDKNHPSIILWSLGNESGLGDGLKAMSEAIRAIDDTRPLHYEGDQDSTYVDVWSRMYASHAEIEAIGQHREPACDNEDLDARRRAMPMMQCEYAASLGTGPGGLSEYQELFYTYPRLMGGLIWEWLEHGILTEDNGQLITNYGGDFGEELHDGNFIIDGLVSVERTPRAQLRDLARVFAPFTFEHSGGVDHVTVTSRLDHTDSSLYSFAWELHQKDGLVATEEVSLSLGPRQQVTTAVPSSLRSKLQATRSVLKLVCRTAQSTPAVPKDWIVAFVDIPSPLLSSPPAMVTTGEPVASLKSLLELDPQTGGPVRIGSTSLDHWSIDLWRAPTDNDLGIAWNEREMPPAAMRWEKLGLDRLVTKRVSTEWNADDSQVIVRTLAVAAGVNSGVDCTFTWTLTDGAVKLDLHVRPVGYYPPEWTSHWARVGLSFHLHTGPETLVKWVGKGPHQAYPDTGQANHWGWFEHSVSDLQDRTVRPQESSRRGPIFRASLGDSLRFWSEDGVGLTARPWSSHLVAQTSHDHLLPDSETTHVVIDFACSGVGSASCGPGVLPAYQLPAQEVRGSITFDPLASADWGAS
jgi:beta-galactosidase